MLVEIKNGVRTNPRGRGRIPRIMVLKCDICGNVYERPYSKLYFDRVHRCSKKCTYESLSGFGVRGADIVDVNCATCGKQDRIYACSFGDHKWGCWFCSRDCYAKYRSEHKELYAENIAAMQTSEVQVRATITRQRRIASGEIQHPRLGKRHSEETKDIIRQRRIENPLIGEKNGMYGRKHTESAKESMSEKHAELLVNGLQKPYGNNSRHGTYKSVKCQREIYYRSSWELAVMKYLDTNMLVSSWDYECMRIPYMYNNHKRWYVPDFFVSFSDGQKQLWEIKPKEFIDSERNKCKSFAANLWCEQNAIKYFILTRDELLDMKILV